MTGAALLALAAALCFAIALILTQYGLRTMPSWRSPIYSIGGPMIVAWMMAAIFVDPAGFNLKAALIFAGVGVVFPVTASILSVRSNEKLGPAVAGDEPVAAAAIGYTLSTIVILSLVGRRAWREGPAHRAGVRWFTAVGIFNGGATFLLYAALGLGSISMAAPLKRDDFCFGKAAADGGESARLPQHGGARVGPTA